MFKAPTDCFHFKKWLDVSKRKDVRKQKGNIFFCANHFEESDIVKFTKKRIACQCVESALESVKKKLRLDKVKANLFREVDVPLKQWRLKTGAYPKTQKGNK